jgi:hypothetical protein
MYRGQRLHEESIVCDSPAARRSRLAKVFGARRHFNRLSSFCMLSPRRDLEAHHQWVQIVPVIVNVDRSNFKLFEHSPFRLHAQEMNGYRCQHRHDG